MRQPGGFRMAVCYAPAHVRTEPLRARHQGIGRMDDEADAGRAGVQLVHASWAAALEALTSLDAAMGRLPGAGDRSDAVSRLVADFRSAVSAELRELAAERRAAG